MTVKELLTKKKDNDKDDRKPKDGKGSVAGLFSKMKNKKEC